MVSFARGVGGDSSKLAHEDFFAFIDPKKSFSLQRCRGQGVGKALERGGEGGRVGFSPPFLL